MATGNDDEDDEEEVEVGDSDDGAEAAEVSGDVLVVGSLKRAESTSAGASSRSSST